MSVRVLSFHAGYGCRHRGRCCTSGWPIAVEEPQRTTIERGLDAGLLIARSGFQGCALADMRPTGPTLLGSTDGRCVFHDDHANGGCRIHRALGHAALPLACRQFPRQSVRHPRGVSVTLSHYCPTAADLLAAPWAPIRIASDAPGFPAGAEYVGFTADASLPPLLHPRLAMDWESWWLFEALSVSLLDDAPDPLPRLGLAVEFTRAWSVGHGPLRSHVQESFERARAADVLPAHVTPARIANRIAQALATVPEEWRGTAAEAVASPMERPVDEGVMRRFVAAHAFANWAAYQGEGLRTWFRAVETAACALMRTSDPGRADLLLRHLADTGALIKRWNDAERESAWESSG